MALTGQPAPDAPAGLTYSFFGGPTISPGGGVVAFDAFLEGRGAVEDAIYVGAPGALRTIAFEGDPAPGTGVNYVGLFGVPAVNDAGQSAYVALVRGAGVTTGNTFAIFAGRPDAEQLVAFDGRPAPGTGVNYTSGFSNPALNRIGHVAYAATLNAPTASDVALFAGDPASPQLVAREGRVAPGTSASVTYRDFSAVALNDAGQVAYSASLRGGGTFEADEGLFVGTPNAPQLVARSGNAAPGTGSTYSTFFTPALNNAGRIAYVADLTGGDATDTNSEALFAGSPAAPQLVARTGNAAPNTGANYAEFFDPSFSDAGRIAFNANLTAGTATNANNAAIFAGDPAAPQLVARTGDAAPGTPAGVVYLDFDQPSINDAGTVVFLAGLTGGGVDATSFVDGLFASTPASGTVLIAREGGLFDVGGGVFRVISDVDFVDDSFGAGRSGLSDNGTIVFELDFTDGTGGIFSAVVPEPTGLALVGLGGAAVLRRRRR